MSVIDRIKRGMQNKKTFCSAVIVAAGNSQRMGKDKILMPLNGKPVIAYTLEAFQKSEQIDEIIVVTKLDNLAAVADICNEYGISKTSKVICGGKTRAESSLAGVLAVSEEANLIAVQDGARPFVSTELIERCVTAAESCSAVAPAVSAIDTVRLLNKKGTVISTPDRDLVALIQTPQVFAANVITNALKKAVDKMLPVTDDCSAVESMGVKVRVVNGDPDNIKLTTARDIFIAERILKEREDNQ